MNEEVTSDQVLKARQLNLDSGIYGTIAEIGAGQEVSRCFFSVGGAAGTVAKTMSAYDMTFSDEIYGPAKRYVSRDRLIDMLDHEYELLEQRLKKSRGEKSKFFAFANTVSAQSYQKTNECHGWMGIRFQLEPLSPPSDVYLHARMTDDSNILQQQALGIFGVNLIYGAYKHSVDLDRFLLSLTDSLGKERIEVDLVEFSGPAYPDVNNRLMTLKLVAHGLSNAVLLGSDGTVQQASEKFYKRPVLIERGSFQPVTEINVEMLRSTGEQFVEEHPDFDREPLSLYEVTCENLSSTDSRGVQELLALCDTLAETGYGTLVTSYPEYYKLVEYIRRFNHEPMALVVGPNTLYYIFDPSFYSDLSGGILEAFGKLFEQDVIMYVYPMVRTKYEEYFSQRPDNPPNIKRAPKDLVTLTNIELHSAQKPLLEYLCRNTFLKEVERYTCFD